MEEPGLCRPIEYRRFLRVHRAKELRKRQRLELIACRESDADGTD